MAEERSEAYRTWSENLRTAIEDVFGNGVNPQLRNNIRDAFAKLSESDQEAGQEFSNSLIAEKLLQLCGVINEFLDEFSSDLENLKSTRPAEGYEATLKKYDASLNEKIPGLKIETIGRRINNLIALLVLTPREKATARTTEERAIDQFRHDTQSAELSEFMQGMINLDEALATPEMAALVPSYQDRLTFGPVVFLKFLGAIRLLHKRLSGKDLEQAPTHFNLPKLVENTLTSIATRFKISDELEFTWEINTEEDVALDVFGYEAEIYIVLMNVMKNICRIMIERKISEEKRHIEVEIINQDGIIILQIIDHAGGIDFNKLIQSSIEAEMRGVQTSISLVNKGDIQIAKTMTLLDLHELMFDRFISARDEKSSGLGLAEVRHIVGTHKGKVMAAPAIDAEGLRFIMTLPSSDGQTPEDISRGLEAAIDHVNTQSRALRTPLAA